MTTSRSGATASSAASDTERSLRRDECQPEPASCESSTITYGSASLSHDLQTSSGECRRGQRPETVDFVRENNTVTAAAKDTAGKAAAAVLNLVRTCSVPYDVTDFASPVTTTANGVAPSPGDWNTSRAGARSG